MSGLMAINEDIISPIYVQFDNGEVEAYATVEDLVCNLEDFDSDSTVDCKVTDSSGRPLRLKLELLDLRELSVIPA